MSTTTVAERILRLRKSQGLTQEELAERASINLRTLQRIEQGKTEPRGHTLRLLATALHQTPEELVSLPNGQPSLPLREDYPVLQFLNISALAFWIIPFGNLIGPAILWWMYRDTVKGAGELGIRLLNVQLTWTCLCYGVLLIALLSAVTRPAGMDPFLPFYLMMGVGVLYLANTVLIVAASFQLKRGMPALYRQAPSFFGRPVAPATLVFLILFGLGMGGNAWAQNRPVTEEPPPPGQLVDIGGWRLHLHGQGAASLPGPSVILESGIGDFSFDWSLVQPNVASFARVYSYDRAGSAWSELGPRPHTMHQLVYGLHTLLHRAQVPGPYVLVGASYGGLLIRLFAEHYPNEVAGMVLVDSGLENSLKYVDGKPVRAAEVVGQPVPPVKKVATPEDNRLAQTPEARKFLDDVLAKSGLSVTSPKVNPAYEKLPEFARNYRRWATSRYEYYAANDNHSEIDELAAMLQHQKQHPHYLGSIPLIVLTSGQSGAPDSAPGEQERKQAQAALQGFSFNSKQVVAHQSGHHIEVDAPDLVTEAIREVVEAARKNERLKK